MTAHPGDDILVSQRDEDPVWLKHMFLAHYYGMIQQLCTVNKLTWVSAWPMVLSSHVADQGMLS